MNTLRQLALALALAMAACGGQSAPAPGDGFDGVADLARDAGPPEDAPAPADVAVPGRDPVTCYRPRDSLVTVRCMQPTPYCCYGLPMPACLADPAPCPVAKACYANRNCPPDHPYCCYDNPNRVACQVSCKVSLCMDDRDCPPHASLCTGPMPERECQPRPDGGG